MGELNSAAAGHLNPDAAADLDEGLLDAPKAAAARRHIAGCAACASLLEELAAVRRVLRADDPGPLPSTVAERLDAALATVSAAPSAVASEEPSAVASEEPSAVGSAAPSATTSSASSTEDGTVPSPAVPRVRTRPVWLRAALSLAAGLAALAALVGGLRTLSGTQSGGSAGSSAARGESSSSALPRPRAAAGGVGSAGNGSASSAAQPGAPAPTPLRRPAPVASSGTAYASTDRALLRQARSLLRHERLAFVDGAAAASAAKAACVQALTGPIPALVDQGRYAGRPALLVVQRTGKQLTVTVLPRPCTARDAAHPLEAAAGRE